MKHLLKFESKNIEGIDYKKYNTKILMDIDIIQSFIEDLIDTGYTAKVSININPVNWYAKIKDLIDLSKYIKENINKSIPTISYDISADISAKKYINIDDNISDLEGRIGLFSTSTINLIRNKKNETTQKTYIRGQYVSTVRYDGSLLITILNRKSRYDFDSNFDSTT